MYEQPSGPPPRRGWATWSSGQRVAAGAGAVAVLAAVGYGAVALTGGGTSGGAPARAASTVAGPAGDGTPGPGSVVTDPAGTATAAAGAPATAGSQAAAAASPARPIDQPGDAGTPCAMTYRAEGRQTRVSFLVTDPGRVSVRLTDTAGKVYRQSEQVASGAVSFLNDVPLSRVSAAAAVLQDDADGMSHACSIGPGR